jgi:hypothetical protein
VSLITVNNIIVVTYCSKCHRLSLSLIAVNETTLMGRPYRMRGRKESGKGEKGSLCSR